MTSFNSPLNDIKVLDLSRVLAGPLAGQILADLGADVIKVERPETGDDTRSWGPPFATTNNDEQGESAYFCCANRNKRSVCIDITTAEGQAHLHKLVAQSDVVLENFKVGQAAKYNLDYPTLTKLNPRLIYCSITGFGQTGPYAERLGYDFLVQAMGGLMSVTGEKDGQPLKVGVAHTDVMTGLYAVIGVLAAIHERKTSGLGQHIDLALFDVTVASMVNQASNYLIGNVVPKPLGNAHPNIVPYQSFATKDSYCVVTIGNDGQFTRFCEVLGLGNLASHPDYNNNAARVKNRDALIPMLQQQLLRHTTSEWLSIFDQANVPAAPINSMDEVFSDPQVIARDLKITMSNEEGDVDLVANPLKFSRTPVQYERKPPKLGEHTDEVLSELNTTKN